MAVLEVNNAEGDPVDRYTLPGGNRFNWCLGLAPHEPGKDALRAMRAEHARLEADMVAAQKQCGRADPDMARWFKAEARRCQRVVKACALWLAQDEIGGPKVRDFPVELSEELDLAAGAYELA